MTVPIRQLFVVSHTHWDREWYHPAARFQQRLVPLIDALLSRPATDTAPFLLDGQTILLDDYLTLRPERAKRLREHLAGGALHVGPWYVLADNLLPSGEAILRNLAAGRRALARFGAPVPRVIYCPDTFGHPAALPTIAAGYGCDVAIVWRGLGGAAHPRTDTMWWYAADDARVLVHHLPPDGYEFGSALPLERMAARARWRAIRDVLLSRNETAVMLLLNGADHHAAQPMIDARVSTLTEHAKTDGIHVVASSLDMFARAALRAAQTMELPHIAGELRDSYGYTWCLQGTFGTRAAQKRRNARLERALLRDVEPWLALAWLHGAPDARQIADDGRITLAQMPLLLHHAWETLLQTHPHDTLCGCSTDVVARAMSARQDAVQAQICGLRESAFHLALRFDVVHARNGGVRQHAPVLVRNRTERSRHGIVEMRLIETIGDVRVGPGSAPSAPLVTTTSDGVPVVGDLVVQRLGTRVQHMRRESPQHYPDDDLVRAERVVAWLPRALALPAFGVRVIDVTQTVTAASRNGDAPPRFVTARETDDEITLGNGTLSLRVSTAGIVLASGTRTWHRALTIDSIMDAGDSYTASLRGEATQLTIGRIELMDRGPLRASVRVTWVLRHANRSRVHVHTLLVLDAASTYLRCDVVGLNQKRNHQLRLTWQTDVRGENIWADAAFGPVPRATPLRSQSRVHEGAEQPTSTMPLHRWVSVSDTTFGAALISDGLAEVAVADGAISVTLLRAIGELSRNTLPERPGHAGWPCPIPQAQSRGAFRARLAILPHAAWSPTTVDQIEDAADAVLLPLIGETWRDAHEMPIVVMGPSLEGDGLRASAVTLTADGDSLLLRAMNLRDHPVVGAWILPDDGPWIATPCRLDETLVGPAVRTHARVPITAAPRALITVIVRRERR